MKIHKGIEEFEGVDCPVLTIGTFDGVHVGHRKILTRLKELATKVNGETVLLTFFPHPRMVLYSDKEIKLINTMEEKQELLKEAGVDHLIIQPFDRSFSEMDPEEYIRKILVEGVGMKYLVIGYDHRFGKKRAGNLENLKDAAPQYGFEVEEIPSQEIEQVDVSSTKIRNALEEGDVEKANKYLASRFSLRGQVVEGRKKGREIGFPTANIHVAEAYKLIPADGVYAVRVFVEGKWLEGMLNIGKRPTFHDQERKRTIEVHIFEWEGELYGEPIEIQFLDRIRGEVKFDGVEPLKVQLEKDRQDALSKIQQHENSV